MSLYWQRQRDMESYGSQHGWISWAQTNVSLSAVKDSFGCCQRFVWVLPFLSCNSINLHCYVCPAMIVIRQWGLSTFPVWRAPKRNILSSNSLSIFNLRSIISIIFISHTEDFQWKHATLLRIFNENAQQRYTFSSFNASVLAINYLLLTDEAHREQAFDWICIQNYLLYLLQWMICSGK